MDGSMTIEPDLDHERAGPTVHDHPSIDQRVAGRIRQARLSNGMSQTELARELGLSLQQVHKYETGRNRMGPTRLYDIASVLGVDIDSLFSDESGPTTRSVAGTGRECLELVRYFRAVPPAERNAVLGFLRAVSDTDDAGSRDGSTP